MNKRIEQKTIDDVKLNTIGKRVCEERKKKNITQKDLANLINIKREKLNYIENDKRFPNIDELILLANVLEVSTDYLLGRVDSKDNDNTYISQKTGLDDEVISVLEDIKFTSYNNILNNLLISLNLDELLADFTEYLNIKYFYKNIFLDFERNIIKNMKKIKVFNKEITKLSDEDINDILISYKNYYDNVIKLKRLSATYRLISIDKNEDEIKKMIDEIEREKTIVYYKIGVHNSIKKVTNLSIDILLNNINRKFNSCIDNMDKKDISYRNNVNGETGEVFLWH